MRKPILQKRGSSLRRAFSVLSPALTFLLLCTSCDLNAYSGFLKNRGELVSGRGRLIAAGNFSRAGFFGSEQDGLFLLAYSEQESPLLISYGVIPKSCALDSIIAHQWQEFLLNDENGAELADVYYPFLQEKSGKRTLIFSTANCQVHPNLQFPVGSQWEPYFNPNFPITNNFFVLDANFKLHWIGSKTDQDVIIGEGVTILYDAPQGFYYLESGSLKYLTHNSYFDNKPFIEVLVENIEQNPLILPSNSSGTIFYIDPRNTLQQYGAETEATAEQSSDVRYCSPKFGSTNLIIAGLGCPSSAEPSAAGPAITEYKIFEYSLNRLLYLNQIQGDVTDVRLAKKASEMIGATEGDPLLVQRETDPITGKGKIDWLKGTLALNLSTSGSLYQSRSTRTSFCLLDSKAYSVYDAETGSLKESIKDVIQYGYGSVPECDDDKRFPYIKHETDSLNGLGTLYLIPSTQDEAVKVAFNVPPGGLLQSSDYTFIIANANADGVGTLSWVDLKTFETHELLDNVHMANVQRMNSVPGLRVLSNVDSQSNRGDLYFVHLLSSQSFLINRNVAQSWEFNVDPLGVGYLGDIETPGIYFSELR